MLLVCSAKESRHQRLGLYRTAKGPASSVTLQLKDLSGESARAAQWNGEKEKGFTVTVPAVK